MTKRTVRVLWTSNIVLPAVAEELGLASTPYGGWLSSMTERLAQSSELTIGIAMRADVGTLMTIEKDGITYFAVPNRRWSKLDVRQQDCGKVLSIFLPDILHVQGTEMRFVQRFLQAWDGKSLIAIQGVVNAIARYELGRLPLARMLNPRHPKIAFTVITLLINHALRFAPRLRHERAIMAQADHILGRTLWDRAQAAVMSPHATYHRCPEILRDEFYHVDWKGHGCERHTIFLGSAALPRKGAHIALQALALLRRDFPDARLYIAGENPERLPAISLKRHIGYPTYLLHLIDRLGLRRHVHFMGVLSAGDMAARMASSHAYLLPSLIENSPNTLGEAMIVGVPVVSAYVGGTPSMATDEQEALFYRADDPEMLAWQLRRIFEDKELASRLSARARARARDP